jgi:hypothetical protein
LYLFGEKEGGMETKLQIIPLGLQTGFDKVPAPKQKATNSKTSWSKKTLYKPPQICLLKRYFD